MRLACQNNGWCNYNVALRAYVSRPYKIIVVSWRLLIGSQVALGILSLQKTVLVSLAALHQWVALLVFGSGIILTRLACSQNVENKGSDET